MDKVTIIQHNVAHWNPYRHTLTNIYRDLDPDILLINSHGLHENEMLKIYGYTTYKVNSTNELHDGSAILIKSNIQHKIKDDFITDIITSNNRNKYRTCKFCHNLHSPTKTLLSIPRLSQPHLQQHTYIHTRRP